MTPLCREHRVIELVVDVHHDDARLPGALLQTVNERLGVRRGNDNRTDLLRDHLFDQVDLLGDIEFVLDAVGQEVVSSSAWAAWCFLAPFGHGQKNSFASDFMTSATRAAWRRRPGLCSRGPATPAAARRRAAARPVVTTGSEWRMLEFFS